MLLIKDIYDLKKYLETRRKMASADPEVSDKFGCGMIYAFDEAIKAVQALIDKQHSEKKET